MAVIVVVAAAAAPTLSATSASSVMAAPLMVPVMVAVPATTPAVNLAVYVPSPLSATAPNAPRVVARTTASPPPARLLPLASLACTVIVDVDWPSAVIAIGLAVIVVVAASAAIAWKLTIALSVIAAPSSVPVIVASPGTRPDVSVAV